MADLLTRLGLRRPPLDMRASAIGLDPALQPERPLEKSWDDATILTVYQDDPWPYVATNIIAETGSEPPLRVGTLNAKDEFTPVGPAHPVQALLDDPAPNMTGQEFVQMLLLYLQLVGHAPIEIVRPKVGPKRLGGSRKGLGRDGFELNAINPAPWRVIPAADGTVAAHVYIKDGREVRRWSLEQMTYVRWLNPRDPFYGLGFVAAVREPIMAEEYAARRDKEFERRYGVPPGILSSKLPIGTQQATELQRRWEQATGGYRNAGKIAVLDSDMTYQAIALSARDAMELDTRKWRVQQISAASGVPMVILAGMKDATFANAAEAVDYLWEFTLAPKMNRIARMISKRLIPLLTDEPLVARFDYADVDALNDNEQEVALRVVTQVQAGAAPTVDEVREHLGLGPHTNAQIGAMIVLPQTISIETPENVLALADMGVLGAQAALDAQLNPPEPVPPGEEPPPEKGPPGKEPPAEKPPAKMKARRTQGTRERATEPVRAGYARDLRAYFAGIRRALQTRRLAEPLPTDDLLDEMLAIINAERFRKQLPRITRTYLETALQMGAEEAVRLLGTDFSIPASQEALDNVTRHLDMLEVQIRNATNEDVRLVITEGLAAGENANQLRARVDQLFDGYEQWRVDRIVRTEVSAAYELGALTQYKDAGYSLVDVDDGDEDDACAEANGSVWTLEEAESNPLEHPNCLPGDMSVVAPNTRAAFARRYEGEIVTIKTAAGHELRGTPNHPVLTRNGWRALGALGEGDYVVRARSIERVAQWIDPNHDHVPASIAKIAEALPVISPSMPTAAEDFHGDVADGDVYVVRANRPLDDWRQATLGEPSGEQASAGRDIFRHAAFAAERAASQVLIGALHTPDGGVGVLADTSAESRVALIAQTRGVTAVAERIAGPTHVRAEVAPVPQPDGSGDLLNRLASLVALDEIVYRDSAVWAGHVYNLETAQGWYMADGIITHNCTRVFSPHFEDNTP